MPSIVVPRSGGAANLERATDRVQAVGHPLEAGPVGGRVDVEADPVIHDGEPQRATRLLEVDRHVRGVRILGHVLHRFQAGEVHGRLDLLGASPDPVSMDVDRYHRLAGLGLQRRREPLVGQQRRIDPPGQVAQVLERVVGLGLDVGQHRLGLRGIAIHQRLRQTLFHRQRHQLLLRTVVDVPLQGLRANVLRGDDAASRLAKVLDQPHVSQHQPRLCGDVATPDAHDRVPAARTPASRR